MSADIRLILNRSAMAAMLSFSHGSHVVVSMNTEWGKQPKQKPRGSVRSYLHFTTNCISVLAKAGN